MFFLCQVEGYQIILKISWDHLVLPHKAFLKNKKGSGTSLPASFSAWLLKKSISLVTLYQLAKFHCQFPVDLVTFTREIFNGKLHFLCSVSSSFSYLNFFPGFWKSYLYPIKSSNFPDLRYRKLWKTSRNKWIQSRTSKYYSSRRYSKYYNGKCSIFCVLKVSERPQHPGIVKFRWKYCVSTFFRNWSKFWFTIFNLLLGLFNETNSVTRHVLLFLSKYFYRI